MRVQRHGNDLLVVDDRNVIVLIWGYPTAEDFRFWENWCASKRRGSPVLTKAIA
jgi:hypothetical protein